MACDSGIRKELFSNIILSGGSTMFNGVTERLQKEMKCLVTSGVEVNIISHPHRKYLSFIGGTPFCQCMRKEEWISKAEYDEIGASIVHMKCS